MITEQDILSKYLGVPFKHEGRSLDGLDCYGLLVMVYRDMGIELVDMEHYDSDWSRRGSNFFIENYHLQWEQVITPRLFDVVLFKDCKGLANHLGIVLTRYRFIHSLIHAGTAVNNLNDRNWMPRVQGFYRYKNCQETSGKL